MLAQSDSTIIITWLSKRYMQVQNDLSILAQSGSAISRDFSSTKSLNNINWLS